MDFLSSLIPHGQSVLSVLLVLGGLIFFHELGHFLVARSLGIGVTTFSLGFGPKLFAFHHGKTEYCLSLVPLGGYCALAGEEPEDNDTSEPQPLEENGIIFEPHELFNLHPAWHRLLVAFAGSAFNLLLAVIIYMGIAWSQGATTLLPVIGQINDNSPAAQAGLQTGDRILAIDDVNISTWGQVPEIVSSYEGNPLSIRVQRDKSEYTLTVTPTLQNAADIYGAEKPIWLIGIRAAGDLSTNPVSTFKAIEMGFTKTWDTITFTFNSLSQLVRGAVPLDALGGPIMIAQVVGQQAQEGVVNVLLLAALISVNLAIFNLLPIPVLDGGLIVFFTLEMLMGRPVNMRIREIAARVGMAFILGLMIFATWNDLVRIFS